MMIPLFVGRPKSLKAIEKAIDGTREILVVSQKSAAVDEPQPKDVYHVGTVCQIQQMLKLPDGIIKIQVEGLYRARIKDFIDTQETFEVTVEEVPDVPADDAKLTTGRKNVLSLFEAYVKLNKKIAPELLQTATGVTDPGRLADIIMANMNQKVEVKQEILEAFDQGKRLELLADLLNKEIKILNIEKKIRGRVRKQMENLQKEHYLRDQMKSIQKELGETDQTQAEVEEYRRKVKEAQMPESAEEKCLKEVEKLSKMTSASAEGGVIRNYLDIMCDLPWSKTTKDRLDVVRAEKILNDDHYGLEEPKQRVLEFLAVCKLKKTIKGPIICFLGPPGVGKTSLGRSIARAMGRKFARISLGGMRDEAEIRGHRKTYVGAMPGRIIQTIRRLGSNNPLILLDEIDKTGSDFKGDPASALLEVLDPEQNSTFTDHYLGVPFDLSKVLFITTANVPHTIPEPLRDRMEIIHIPGYTEEEKLEIGARYLVTKQRKENGIKTSQLQFSNRALIHCIRYYTREAGVRELERKIGSICRKVARKIINARSRKLRIRMAEKSVKRYLGIPKYRYGKAEEKNEVGLVMGLAWTQVGGTILPIEVVTMSGTGKVILTGQLGKVMQESAQAAVSYVRTRVNDFKIRRDFYKRVDVHIHAPEGAIPKDGPSAGVTIGTAVISALSGIPVRRDVAMTGEITLKGKVLPVGGIKEKVLAAFRTGIKTIILCEENRKDLEDIPPKIYKKIKFHLVSHISQVLDVALVKEPGHPPSAIRQPSTDGAAPDVSPATLRSAVGEEATC
ncbi:MAG: endopeptidase La [Candidatus Riflebacteria bacterium]|nr:endopeptidase La [Candidatus Riflebacteria bacterium]